MHERIIFEIVTLRKPVDQGKAETDSGFGGLKNFQCYRFMQTILMNNMVYMMLTVQF